MDSKMYEDIVECVLYPKKIPASMLFCDVSQGEYMLMGAFLNYEREHDGKHITVNELAAVLDVAVPSVSRMLKNLESRGLIVRETDKDCRRNTLVFISEKGMKLFRENEKIIRHCVDMVAGLFTEDEIKQLMEYRKRIEIVMEKEIKNIEALRKEKQQ
ncbi:MAG: MarR family transcriptional regulator [Clostridia bacterium]|nr:MarR family transcriptional regulator [Clostridia bacterium]